MRAAGDSTSALAASAVEVDVRPAKAPSGGPPATCPTASSCAVIEMTVARV